MFAPPASNAPRSVGWLRFGAGRSSIECRMRSTWRRPAARGDHGVDVLAVEQRAHLVAVAREDARQHRDEIRRHRCACAPARAEIDRRAEVEQEPRRDLAVLVVLAHVGRLQARGDVPVDVAHVVAILVLAQVGEIQAEAAEQRAVVALQQAVETAQAPSIPACAGPPQDFPAARRL
jgi:hypothetical protein